LVFVDKVVVQHYVISVQHYIISVQHAGMLQETI